MEPIDRTKAAVFDEDAASQRFTTLSLGEEVSAPVSNGAFSRAKGEVDSRIRLAPRGPRQLASRSRENYAVARRLKQQPINPINHIRNCQSVGEDIVMADVDTGGRRTGGGRGHYNPRKRRFRAGKLDALALQDVVCSRR